MPLVLFNKHLILLFTPPHLTMLTSDAFYCLSICFLSTEILPQEISAGPAAGQTSGNLRGAVVGGTDGLHHRGRHKGEWKPASFFFSTLIKMRVQPILFQYFDFYLLRSAPKIKETPSIAVEESHAIDEVYNIDS